MSKSKSLIYISVSILIIAVLSLSFCVLRINDKADHVTKINLATLDPDLYDQSWLTGDPCAAPCWFGLKPNETSRENSMTVVSKLPFIESSTMQESSTNVYFPFKIRHDNLQSGVVITFEDDILSRIYITPNYPITIDQVVKKLGEPDGFSAYPTDTGGTGYYLAVIWKKKQLVLEYREDSGDISFWSKSQGLYEKIRDNNGKIPKNLIVQDVLYTTPYYIDRMMNYKKWKGFADN
jgi:hypothetical protein